MLIGQDLNGEQVLKTTLFTIVLKNTKHLMKSDKTFEKHIQWKLQTIAEKLKTQTVNSSIDSKPTQSKLQKNFVEIDTFILKPICKWPRKAKAVLKKNKVQS